MPSGQRPAMDIPVLCLDTCILLDMLRDPTRKDVRVDHHNSSLALLAAAQSGPAFEVCIAEQVEKEFLDHVDEVEKDARRRVKSLQDQTQKLNSLVSLHGTFQPIYLHHWSGHEVRCRFHANLWMKAGTIVKESSVTLGNAFHRVTQARTPARRGKQSIKDCVILETYLEHIQSLRSAGRTAPAIFVSSNTQDYASKNKTTINDDIKSEFQALNLRFAPNMGAARGILGI